ncbi:MAG TPA: CPCC family cysteine-rich protein [Thermomicrobiales bacterium]|nr:CPCC family cysteine-rich protein [Thermomicrobiales bacterium]
MHNDGVVMVEEKFACPCCGFLTLPREPPGTYGTCLVCGWEDDLVQFRDPDYRGGANKVSLNEARQNYAAIGASEERLKQLLRPPREEEIPPGSSS